MRFLKPTPINAIPMDLEDSFTPVEFLAKLNFKINEIILNINQLKEITAKLETEIETKTAKVLEEAKQYTDEQIALILNYKTISAKGYDDLEITAQQYDNMNITAYQYDTESQEILISN